MLSDRKQQFRLQTTRCLIEGSIFNAHWIARSHLSSRCNTAIRCLTCGKYIKTYTKRHRLKVNKKEGDAEILNKSLTRPER